MAAHTDTTAIVTGGGQGLGLAIAHQLADEGCRKIVLVGRNADKGARAVAELKTKGVDAHFLSVDMGDIPAVTEMVDKAVSLMGSATALVNCAANTGRGSILDTSPELWDQIMDPNTKGPFFALQRFAQLAIEAGHPASAVNILSIVVHGGLPFLAPYGASKSALLYVTRNAAHTLASHRIRVNGINVGWMDTPGEDEIQKKFHGRKDGWLAAAEAGLPFGQLVKPEEVARQASFFLSSDSGVVTGSVMDFDQQVPGAYPDTNDH